MGKLQNFLKGIIKENPVLVLLLGTCPTLAVTTSALNALGMGVAASVGTQVVGVIVELLGWSGLTALFAVLAVLGSIAAAAVKRVLK